MPTVHEEQSDHPDIYVGKVKLQTGVVDNIAGAFLQSSRKTLHFVPPTKQNGEIIIRPTKEVVDNGSKKWQTTTVGYCLAGGRTSLSWKHLLVQIGRGYSRYLQLPLVSSSSVSPLGLPWKTSLKVVLGFSKVNLSCFSFGSRACHYDGRNTLKSQFGFASHICRWNTGRRRGLARLLVALGLHYTRMSYSANGKEDPKRVDVEYEWLPQWCTHCCSLGHVPVMESEGPEATSVCKKSAPVLGKGKELILYNSYGALAIDGDDSQLAGPNICSPIVVNVQRVRRNLLLNWSWFDDYSGPEGRIWLAWNPLEVGVDILRVESQFVHCRAFNKRLHTRCLLTVLYGAYDLIPRRNLWSALCNLSAVISNEPCEGPRSLWKRLDRMLANTNWMDAWPNSSYISALPSTSDHSPLILNGMDRGEEHIMFCFDNYLAHLPGFLNSVEEIWRHRIVGTTMYETVCKLKLLKALFRQQKRLKGNLTDNVRQAKNFLDKAQALFTTYKEDIFLDLVKSCRRVYSVAVKLEISMLHQRAKLRWLKHGDQSSKKSSSARTDIPLHFRNAWPVIGQTLFQAVDEFFRTVSLNGSIHGFFKGGRGLRQGDPMSHNLFVLVMEIWNLLLKFRIKEAANFQYHWKCKDIGLINLCFADDVLLFCKAHLPSIIVISDALNEFAALSGLKVNPAKSQIIFSRAVQQERQQMLDYLGFQEGSLPVKYLGIPLTSSRLTIADCRPLIDKVDARLAGWNNQILSYAGRLQLINSFGKARLEGENAKVAWEWISKPKEEGGLGIRRLTTTNQALMLKQLWRILQNDGTSIWVDWIQRYRLRHSTIWTFNGALGSWGWKKMLKLRPLLQRGVINKIGDGSSFSLWQDPWHERGPLCFILPRGPEVIGLPLSSPLSSVIQRHQWCWPASTDTEFIGLTSQLPPLHSSAADCISWRSSSGTFTVPAAVSLIQRQHRKCFGEKSGSNGHFGNGRRVSFGRANDGEVLTSLMRHFEQRWQL
ncbi:Transposon TX1 uncharacterized protein [Sesamum angolense]|uniref:Transposon TX1 uncharacterized protein n=1 Tax=Sesamum angolense TaxID=2727404 RepID=A0AAE1VZB8_9LAMI|nr:Transposon TX1 uncharacterized protein [Sesamum angolense]